MSTIPKEQKNTAEYSGTRYSLTYILNNVIDLVLEKKMRPLEKYLMGLPADKVYWVETVMYLGRDDFRVEDIDENYEYLCSCGPPEDTICNMLGKEPTQLKNYLEAGIKALKKHKVDIDTLPNITK